MSVHSNSNPWHYAHQDSVNYNSQNQSFGLESDLSLPVPPTTHDQVFRDEVPDTRAMPTREADYEILSVIGAGSYGKVYCAKVKDSNNPELLVLKKVPLRGLEENERTWAIREAELMSKLPSHENVVKHYVSFIENEVLIIVMEYCEGGDLDNRLTLAREKGGSFSEETVWSVLIQVCYALNHMHSHRIIHRDIKPQNIFLDKFDRVKVGDLGLGRLLSSQTHAGSRVGTPLYQSPELCMTQQYDERADVWALGCVAYQMLTLKPPFIAQTSIALANKIAHTDPNPLPKTCSNNLQFLIFKMLSKHPQQRPDTHRILSYGPIESRVRAAQHKAQLEEAKLKFEKQLKEHERENSKLVDELERTRQHLSRASERYCELQPQLLQLNETIETLQDTLECANAENDSLTKENVALKTRVAQLVKVVDETENENATFRKRLDQFVLKREEDTKYEGKVNSKRDSLGRYQFEDDDELMGICEQVSETSFSEQISSTSVLSEQNSRCSDHNLPNTHENKVQKRNAKSSDTKRTHTKSPAGKKLYTNARTSRSITQSKSPKIGHSRTSAFSKTASSKKDGTLKSKTSSASLDKRTLSKSSNRDGPKTTSSQLGPQLHLNNKAQTPFRNAPKTPSHCPSSAWASTKGEGVGSTLTPRRVFFTSHPTSERRLSSETTMPGEMNGNSRVASPASAYKAAETTSYQVASSVLSPSTCKTPLKFSPSPSPALGPALRVPVDIEDQNHVDC